MNKIQAAAIISLVAFILSAIGYVSTDDGHNIRLQIISESCECQSNPGKDCIDIMVEWNNGTHYKNNAYCEMLEIRK